MAKSWLLALLLLGGCANLTALGGLSATEQTSLDNRLALALRYIEAGNRDMANIHLRKAAEIAPQAAELHHAYALLYQMEGDSELAGQFFQRALQARPDYTLAHYNYGALHYRRGDVAAARSHMLIASGDLASERRPQALYILGLCEHQLGNRSAALAAYQRAVQLAPQLAPAYLAAAQVLFEQRQWRPALAQLQRYEQLAAPTASSLWLEVQLAALLDEPDLFASASMALRNLFPNSPQTESLRQRFGAERAVLQESSDVQ